MASFCDLKAQRVCRVSYYLQIGVSILLHLAHARLHCLVRLLSTDIMNKYQGGLFYISHHWDLTFLFSRNWNFISRLTLLCEVLSPF
ncbi:hypothetical protein B0T13DRAFT_141375 [Neurospora crassa]|nr:hypothetical protein B0T13DRAFT_141375 [Neurospora crassa]